MFSSKATEITSIHMHQ